MLYSQFPTYAPAQLAKFKESHAFVLVFTQLDISGLLSVSVCDWAYVCMCVNVYVCVTREGVVQENVRVRVVWWGAVHVNVCARALRSG